MSVAKPPTTIHASVCSACGTIANAGRTHAEISSRTDCPMCPLGASVLTIYRYQLAPKKSRNAKKATP